MVILAYLVFLIFLLYLRLYYGQSARIIQDNYQVPGNHPRASEKKDEREGGGDPSLRRGRGQDLHQH